MKIDDKKLLVEDLKEKLARSKVLIVVDYKGLDVATMTDLRKKLRDADVECKVVKNTLLAMASRQTDVEAISDSFKGPTAIAVSYSDPVAPAKVLIEFAKANTKLGIKKGVMGSKILELKDIEALSSLPSREVLLGKLLSVMNAVPASVVQVLAAVPRSLVNVLQAIRDQKEKEAA
jgi:large subunit ribosomal protein L10